MDSLITLTSKLSKSLSPNEPDAQELAKKLSSLRGELSTSPCKIAASVLSCGQDARPTFEANSSQHDSGYVSLESIPSTINGRPLLSDPKLHIFSMSVPDELKYRFLDMKVLYTQSLWQAVSGKRKRDPGDISMKLRFMGENERDVHLYILVQCERRVSKDVKRFFAQDHVLEDLNPYFRVHIIDTGLRQLSNNEAVRVYSAFGGLKSPLYGMPIEMRAGDASRLATLGGLIMVTKEEKTLYGLTAGHPLAKICRDPPYRPASWEQSDSSSSDGEESETDSEPDLESNCEPASEHLRPLGLGQECLDQDQCFSRNMEVEVGNIIGDSLRSMRDVRNYDWALIGLTPEYGASNGLDALLWSSSAGIEQNIRQMCDEIEQNEGISKDLFSVEWPRSLFEQPVIVVTSHGLQRGTLTSCHSCLMISPGRTFVETLDFSPNQGSNIRPGDSGSWVVNETTGEVYGHVVSIDALGEAYVMPIQSTLLNIQDYLGSCEIRIPTTEEVLQLWCSNAISMSTMSSLSSGLTPPLESPMMWPIDIDMDDRTTQHAMTARDNNRYSSRVEPALNLEMPVFNPYSCGPIDYSTAEQHQYGNSFHQEPQQPDSASVGSYSAGSVSQRYFPIPSMLAQSFNGEHDSGYATMVHSANTSPPGTLLFRRPVVPK